MISSLGVRRVAVVGGRIRPYHRASSVRRLVGATTVVGQRDPLLSSLSSLSSSSSLSSHLLRKDVFRTLTSSTMSNKPTVQSKYRHGDSGADDDANNNGFGASIHRRRNHKVSSSRVAIATNPNDDYSEEQDWQFDDGTTTNYNNEYPPAMMPTSDYDFGVHDGKSKLQDWHTHKEERLRHLSSNVGRILESPSPMEDENDVLSILSLMEELNSFSRSITSEMHSLNDFRRRHDQYPPSQFMTETTFHAAEQVEGLLTHLLVGFGGEDGEGKKPMSSSKSLLLLTPEQEVQAYRLTMAAWSQVYHPEAGDRCETILEQYGERFGGDINYMPSVDSYKTVLMAHWKSCSSIPTTTTTFDPSNGIGSPGEKALDLLTLLKCVHTAGDMFLMPDAELYALTVAVIRNTLLDWQQRRRYQSKELRRIEEKLARGLVDALGHMESLLDETIQKSRTKGEGHGLSLQQWDSAIGAYANGVAITACIPTINDKRTNGALLMKKFETFITENSDGIVHSIKTDHLDDGIDVQKLLEGIQWRVEDAYTSALSTGLKLSKETGYFADFHSAHSNAMASDAIVSCMRTRAQEAPPDKQFLFPSPTPQNYRALVMCWCECVRKRYSNPESNIEISKLTELPHLRAATLLRELEVELAGRPMDGSIYVDVIWAWGQVMSWPGIYRNHNDYFFAANAVDVILKRAMSQYANEIVFFHWRGTVTKMYNIIFRMHSKIFKGADRIVKRSLTLLDEMEHWYRQSNGAIAQPDEFTFALLLKTISNSGLQSSASTAESVIQRMNDIGVMPREKHYIGLIRAYYRVGQMDVSDPRKAETILRQVKEIYNRNKMVKPNTSMYSAVISAYGGSREYNSVSKVMELFEELKALHKETNDDAFKPDSMLYSAVIDAIAKAKTKNSASLHQAIKLLEKMEHSQDIGETEMGPNRYAYTNILHAINQTRMKDGVTLAEELLHRMDSRSRRLNDESIRPDTQAYTTLIQTFANSKQPDAVQRAQKWFQQMETRAEEGDSGCKPNKVTCTALINCWRRSERAEAGEEAENIISMMERRYEEGVLDMKPDAFVYASAIDAWARGKSPDKSARAWSIYQRMKSQYSMGNMDSKPNNVIMTSIIKACGYTHGGREDKQKALRVLLECMGELKSTNVILSTPLTYRSLLNATRALVDDDSKRRPISATIFETCCRNGQLDTTVLEALESAQPELYAKLPSDIPPKWNRNVVKEYQK